MKKILFGSLILCLFHCSDVIIPNISEDLVLLRSPQDDSQLIGNEITLSWEALPDAIDYRVEVAQPSFAALQQLVVDSITTALNLSLSLPEGQYEWRVTAFNEAYSSACCEEWSFQLFTNTSADLSSQTLVLQSPATGAAFNSTMLSYSWEPLSAATHYRFQLSEVAGFGTLSIDTLLTSTDITIANLTEQDYYWRVRAESTTSNTFTDYSSRQFSIDQTAPPAPVLLLPIADDTLVIANQNPDFSWESSSTSIRDTLYIYEDVFLDQLLWKEAVTDQVIDLDNTGISFPSGDYFWNVRSVDAAGNVSSSSDSRKFIIQ